MGVEFVQELDAHLNFMFYGNYSIENLVTEFDGVVYEEEWRFHKKLKLIYQVSSFGRIKVIGRKLKTDGRWSPERILSQSKGRYMKFKSKSVHRLVAELFCDNSHRKPQVNHRDTNKHNNFFKNLEWCTPSENNEHAVINGLTYKIKHVSYEDRMFIRENMRGDNRSELAALFNITEDQVYYIGTNRDTNFMKIKIIGDSAGLRKSRKKTPSMYKPIIDLNTGIFWTTDEVAFLLGTKRRYVYRILLEERQPNRTQFRYA